ncbi:hypothetical protein HPB47_005406 [Ixodes persulcatus]|uniref:Uncharacterized protein n=1 Tax=Ixodes persulcatus TaxID=34615 RepID=A0AC60PDX5_IXOPE|nr:hypothetical protein HPB47_005406 [Ixodes persulcatus]
MSEDLGRAAPTRSIQVKYVAEPRLVEHKMAATDAIAAAVLLVVLLSCPEVSLTPTDYHSGHGGAVTCDKSQLPSRSVVCYVKPGDPHFDLSHLDPCLCTHLVYGTLEVQGDLSLGPFVHENLTALNVLREHNPHLVPMVELRGLDHVVQVPTQEQLAELVQHVSKAVAPTKPRGLDVDYQLHGVDYQVAMEQKPVLGHFLHHFRQESPLRNPVVSVTVAKEPHLVNHAYDFRTLVKNADYINVPAFMFHDGQPEYAVHPAPLHGDRGEMDNTDSLVNLVLAMGVPRQKVIVGVPMFGMTYRLADPQVAAMGAPLYHGADDSYKFNHPQFCALQHNLNFSVERDADLTAPYAVSGDAFMGFEDELSLRLKGKYVQLQDLGGVYAYAVNDDDSRAVCGQGHFPLLHSLHEGITGVAHGGPLEYVETNTETKIVRIVDQQGNNLHVDGLNSYSVAGFTCTRPGHFRDPKDCTKFFRCVKYDSRVHDYTVFLFDCPAGLVFDDRIEVCNWPSWSDQCHGSGELSTTPRSAFHCPGVGYYQDPENCRWFYFCDDTYENGTLTAFDMRCPHGLGFDPTTFSCNYRAVTPGCKDYAGVVQQALFGPSLFSPGEFYNRPGGARAIHGGVPVAYNALVQRPQPSHVQTREIQHFLQDGDLDLHSLQLQQQVPEIQIEARVIQDQSGQDRTQGLFQQSDVAGYSGYAGRGFYDPTQLYQSQVFHQTHPPTPSYYSFRGRQTPTARVTSTQAHFLQQSGNPYYGQSGLYQAASPQYAPARYQLQAQVSQGNYKYPSLSLPNPPSPPPKFQVPGVQYGPPDLHRNFDHTLSNLYRHQIVHGQGASAAYVPGPPQLPPAYRPQYETPRFTFQDQQARLRPGSGPNNFMRFNPATSFYGGLAGTYERKAFSPPLVRPSTHARYDNFPSLGAYTQGLQSQGYGVPKSDIGANPFLFDNSNPFSAKNGYNLASAVMTQRPDGYTNVYLYNPLSYMSNMYRDGMTMFGPRFIYGGGQGGGQYPPPAQPKPPVFSVPPLSRPPAAPRAPDVASAGRPQPPAQRYGDTPPPPDGDAGEELLSLDDLSQFRRQPASYDGTQSFAQPTQPRAPEPPTYPQEQALLPPKSQQEVQPQQPPAISSFTPKPSLQQYPQQTQEPPAPQGSLYTGQYRPSVQTVPSPPPAAPTFAPPTAPIKTPQPASPVVPPIQQQTPLTPTPQPAQPAPPAPPTSAPVAPKPPVAAPVVTQQDTGTSRPSSSSAVQKTPSKYAINQLVVDEPDPLVTNIKAIAHPGPLREPSQSILQDLNKVLARMRPGKFDSPVITPLDDIIEEEDDAAVKLVATAKGPPVLPHAGPRFANKYRTRLDRPPPPNNYVDKGYAQASQKSSVFLKGKTLVNSIKESDTLPSDKLQDLKEKASSQMSTIPEVACTRVGLFRHPADCGRFYECFYDKWLEKFTVHEFECPIKLAFDASVSACSSEGYDKLCRRKKSSAA